MPTRITVHHAPPAHLWSSEDVLAASRLLAPLGRALFAAIFILAVPGHFTQAFVAAAAAQGVPAPQILVPLAGMIALLGGMSILLGYHARIGALLVVVFLIPVTLYMHNFWAVTDPTMRMMQQANFMKNISMLGGALLIARCGSGPFSLSESGR